MKVRMAALQAIGALSTLPSHLLYPHAVNVVLQLDSCVDDKKRLVRKEAVKARAEWWVWLWSRPYPNASGTRPDDPCP